VRNGMTTTSHGSIKVDTLAKQVLFCTIRITNRKKSGKVEIGTGFLFNALDTPLDPAGRSVPLLVSNEHVFADAAVLRLDFLLANVDGSGPELGQVARDLTADHVGKFVGGVDAALGVNYTAKILKIKHFPEGKAPGVSIWLRHSAMPDGRPARDERAHVPFEQEIELIDMISW
jgi:hypothetical protein